jgi:hypothetical protein
MAKQGDNNWISGGVAVGLVVVSALAMVAFLALSAYAPQFRTETGGRPNVLSKSAIGFAGIRVMLEETGTVVEVNRGHERLAGGGLLILTPDATSSGPSVAALAAGGAPVLIVLPKWVLVPDYLRSGWVRKVWAFDPTLVAAVLKGLDESATVVRPGEPDNGKAKEKPFSAKPKAEKPVEVVITSTPSFGPSPYPPKLTIDGFQTVAGKKWAAVLTDGKGHAVLAQLRGTNTFVLADPDLLNTAALKNERVAAGALTLISRLPGSKNEVVFDVTLAGFDAKRSLLRSVFGPPFLAATLCALLAAALMAFRAMNRFGSPREEERSFAFGKRSLADNTASLIRVMARGPGMAPRYAAAVRRLAAKTLRGGRVEDIEWLDAIERSSRIAPTYSELLVEAESVESETALMKLAAKLHDWKSRITHERL